MTNNKDEIHQQEIYLYHLCRKIQKLKIGKTAYKQIAKICRESKDEETFYNRLRCWSKYDEIIEEEIRNAGLLIFQAGLILIHEVLPCIREQYSSVNLLDEMERLLPGIHPLSIEADNRSLLPLHANKFNIMQSIFDKENPYNFSLGVLKDEESIEVIKQLQTSGVSLFCFALIVMMTIDQVNKAKGGAIYERTVKSIISNETGLPLDQIQSGVKDFQDPVEFDCFFEFEGSTFGISVKKTLRERYRMNMGNRSNSRAMCWLTVTLGDDLTESVMQKCIENGIKIFVSDEIYHSNEYLRIVGVYPATKLTADTLRLIAKSEQGIKGQ